MYQNYCKKCGSTSLHTETKGSNIGLYCDDCGAWVKWLGKDELRAFEHGKQEINVSESEDEKDIVIRLEKFAEYLDNKINLEMSNLAVSNEDAIRKSAYCLALERDKNAIYNIINGKDFDYRRY